MAARKQAAGASVAGGRAEIDVKLLRAAAKSVSAVIEKRNTVPILAGTLLASGPSTLTLTGTDLDMEIAVQVDLAETGTGRAMHLVVDAGTLEKIAAKLPADAQLVIEQQGNTAVKLVCGRSRFSLPMMDAGQFPTFVAGEWAAQFEMGRGELQALIAAVRFAQCSDETRYFLNGIFLQAVTEGPEAGHLVAAATDGHRLAECRCALPEGAEPMPDIILGRKAVGVIERLLDAAEEGTVEIAVSATKLRLDVGAVSFVTKLVDGTFPDHRRVIPRANPHRLWIDPPALAEAVDRVLSVNAEKTRQVVLVLPGGGGSAVSIEASSPERGQASEELAADWAGPEEEMRVGFNGGYLLAALAHLTASPALLAFNGPKDPVLMIDAEDGRRVFVVMPMRA